MHAGQLMLGLKLICLSTVRSLLIYHSHFSLKNSRLKSLIEVLPIVTPDSKVHGANMGPTWVLLALDGPHKPCYQGQLGCVHYHVVYDHDIWESIVEGTTGNPRNPGWPNKYHPHL